MLISEKIYKHLKGKIINGDFAPGETLTINNLSKLFNVSRTPIKEAINQLSMDGLVRNLDGNKGAIVNILSIRELDEIYQLRRVLEPFAVKLAMHNIPPKELDKIEKRFTKLKEKILDSPDRNAEKKITQMLYDFHRTILKAANNDILYHFMDNLYSRIEVTKKSIIKPNFQNSKEMVDHISTHLKLVSLLKDKDLEQAEKMTILHIEDALRKLANIF